MHLATLKKESHQRWESRWSRARSRAQAAPKLPKKNSSGSHFPNTLSSPLTAVPPPPPIPGTSLPGTEPRASTYGTQTTAASTASLSVSATPIPLPSSPLLPLRSFSLSLSAFRFWWKWNPNLIGGEFETGVASGRGAWFRCPQNLNQQEQNSDTPFRFRDTLCYVPLRTRL